MTKSIVSLYKLRRLILIFVLTIYSSILLGQTSNLTADTYDEEKNTTTLVQIPYSNIVIPGKWTRTKYNTSSQQILYENQDSVTISVVKLYKRKYSFYTTGQNDKDFVLAFYKWDSDYYKSNEVNVQQLADSSGKGYIIWKATGKHINSVFLFGAKKKLAYNFATMTNKWTDKQSEAFLIDLFNNN